MKKFLLAIVLLHASLCAEQERSESFLDTVKDCCVSILPKKWQKQAKVYFWPVVSSAAVCAIVALVWFHSRKSGYDDPREIYGLMGADLLSADPLRSATLHNGRYALELHVFDDSYVLQKFEDVWPQEGGASLMFYRDGRRIYTRIFKTPISSPGPIVYDALEGALQTLNI